MENRKAKLIRQIERVLADDELVEEQRQTLQAFDRFNELEAQCRLGTRHSYLRTLHELGVCVQKPYEEMKNEELQMHVANQKTHHRPSVVMLQQTHLKRFPTIPELKNMLLSVGFRNIRYSVESAGTERIYIRDYLARIRKKFASTLTLLSEEDFQRGLKVFEKRLTEKWGDKKAKKRY